MVSDATVVHTCAASYLSQTAISAGSAAEQAVIRKSAKYVVLPAAHVFVSITSENLGSVNVEGGEFLSELGRRISSVSGDQRKTYFHLQLLSTSVQRHNNNLNHRHHHQVVVVVGVVSVRRRRRQRQQQYCYHRKILNAIDTCHRSCNSILR